MQSFEYEPPPGNVALSGCEIAPDSRLVALAQVWRHQDGEVLSDQLARRISEDSFGGRVGETNSAAFIDDDDHVGRGIDHTPISGFALGETACRLFALLEHGRGDERRQAREREIDIELH